MNRLDAVSYISHDRDEENDERGQTEEGEHEAETISPVHRSRK